MPSPLRLSAGPRYRWAAAATAVGLLAALVPLGAAEASGSSAITNPASGPYRGGQTVEVTISGAPGQNGPYVALYQGESCTGVMAGYYLIGAGGGASEGNHLVTFPAVLPQDINGSAVQTWYSARVDFRGSGLNNFTMALVTDSGGGNMVTTCYGRMDPATWATDVSASIDNTTPRVGDTLTASIGSPSPTPGSGSVSYTWAADGSTVSLLGSQYVVKQADVGKAITVKVVALAEGYTSSESTSAPTSAVLAPKVAQTISFEPTSTGLVGGEQVLSATATSGLPVALAIDEKASDEGVCTLDESTLTYVGAGVCAVTASQAGDDTYTPADDVSETITVSKVAQTISFDPAVTGFVGGQQVLSATASSGLPVALAIDEEASDEGVCTLDESTLTYVGAGVCVVTASGPGDDTYAPAEKVTGTITVTFGDGDGDGLTDDVEEELGTDPASADTDGDGLGDGAETRGFDLDSRVYKGVGTSPRPTMIGLVRTDPLVADSDGDGLTDRAEVRGIRINQRVLTSRPSERPRGYVITSRVTNPLVADTDADGLSDLQEVTGSATKRFGSAKTDPNRADTDKSGRSDGREVELGSNPTRNGR